MTGVRLLECPIQPYAWGSHTSIAQIQGRPNPTEDPEAELWIGDHPNAPCRVRPRPDREETVDLRSFLAENPSWLGSDRVRAATAVPRLPFLLKILAADAPLSLQVHPSADRARTAFAAGHPAYVDDQPKPEILCALTPFRAMVGFRPFQESAAHIRALIAELPTQSPAVTTLVGFSSDPGSRSLKELLAGLHRLTPEAVDQLTRALRRLDLRATDVDSRDSAAITTLLEHYPTDPLCIAPLLLQVVTLQPGEAIHTDAGILHSYLGGTGVELMNTSDNVLRAGLTEKPVHLDELLEVTVFEPTPPGRSQRLRSDGDLFDRFQSPGETFELGVLDWTTEDARTQPAGPGIQVLLCTRGHFEVRNQSEVSELPSGRALLVGAGWGPFELRGEGQLFRATVPQHSHG